MSGTDQPIGGKPWLEDVSEGLGFETLRLSGNDISLRISPSLQFNPSMVSLQPRSRYAPRYEPTLAREICATVEGSNGDEVAVRLTLT